MGKEMVEAFKRRNDQTEMGKGDAQPAIRSSTSDPGRVGGGGGGVGRSIASASGLVFSLE